VDHPRSAFGAPPLGGAPSGRAKPVRGGHLIAPLLPQPDAADYLRLVAQAVAAGQTVVLWCGASRPRSASAQAAREVSERLAAAAPPAGFRISRSATDGLAVVAVSATHSIGIDVQDAGRDAPPWAEVRTWLHPNERLAHDPASSAWSPAAVWSRKEAVLKALGVGLAGRPQGVDCGASSSEWRRVVVPPFGSALLRSIETPGSASGLAAALAVAGDAAAPTLRLTSWPD
jgi:hypothetical protein